MRWNVKTQPLRVHLHSDHTVGFPDMILTPWVLGREKPLYVYSPIGLQEMTDHILTADAEDIQERLDGLLILYYQLLH